MKNPLLHVAVTALFVCVTATAAFAQNAQPLKLIQTIPMPRVKGRIDHMDVDVKGKRLARQNRRHTYEQKSADTYEIAGKIPTRPGAGTWFWSPELNRCYVAAPAKGQERAVILVFEPMN